MSRPDPSGGYDRLARCYRTLERLLFGGSLMRSRLAHLPALDGARRVLIAGEGDGRFVAALCRRNPEVEVVCVERSGAMIARAQRRLGSETARVRFLRSDIRHVAPEPGSFDGVVTHFVLDLFDPDDLSRLVPQLAVGLRPGGVWLAADFSLPTTGAARMRAQLWLWLLYRVFGAATDLEVDRLHDPVDHLLAAGLRCDGATRSQAGLLTSRCWHRPGAPLAPGAERRSPHAGGSP